MEIEYIIILILISIILIYIIKKKIEKIIRKRKFKRGLLGEIKAGKYLEKNGYEIIEYQKELKYEYLLDEDSVQVRVRPDYIVKKRGKLYIAEVKTGEFAPNIIKNRETRRQIMEYSFAFEYNGVLLVDIENQKILSVKFKKPKQIYHKGIILCITIFLIISLICNVCLYLKGSV